MDALTFKYGGLLILRNDGVTHRLDMDHAVLKNKRIHSIGDTPFGGIGSPFEEEDVLDVGCLK